MKYHIFIGSTLDDLKNERKGIPRIIMALGKTTAYRMRQLVKVFPKPEA